MRSRAKGKGPPPARSGPPVKPAGTTVALERQLAEAKACHHQSNDPTRALALYEAILATHPGQVEALHGASLIHLARDNFAAAIEYMERALLGRPGHPVLLYNLGIAWMGREQWIQALDRFQEVLRIQPDHLQALCQSGRILLQQKRLDEAVLVLQKAVQLAPEMADAHNLFAAALRAMDILPLADCHRTLARHYANQGMIPDSQPPRHTLFLNRDRALQVARQNNLVPETIQMSGLQVCYHPGTPLPDDPPNLVAIPLEQQAFETFFAFTRLSQPTAMDFAPHDAEERLLANRLATLLYHGRRKRVEEARRLDQICRATQPAPLTGQPLRVFLPASRTTDVMMFNTRDLTQGFRKQGCEVLYCIEASNMETFYFNHYLQAQADFNPQIVVDINNYFGLAAHPDVFRILWYTDRMPTVMKGEPIAWRERDLLYSLSKELDPDLLQCGATDVQRQGFCYNSDIFQDFGQPRKQKAVLVASAHNYVLEKFPGCDQVLNGMKAMFEQGEPMTDAALERFSRLSSLSKGDLLFFHWEYVVRNMSARWLCELSSEVEVDVYGHRWDHNEAVRPFNRGVLPHGPAVAALYNEARYVLVPHPHDLQSQRLVEVSACGALPVVYDCRYRAEPPHWDDNCLWYRTKEDMRACLTGQRQPPASTRQICQGRSYEEFARRILARVAACQNR
ncbi:MAG: tetratricopeptide repeat protein [Magnetococcus sp. DMHC-8]